MENQLLYTQFATYLRDIVSILTAKQYHPYGVGKGLENALEIRRNTQKHAETPKQKHQAKTPSKNTNIY